MKIDKTNLCDELHTYVLNILFPINRITYHRFYLKDRVLEIRKFTNGKNSIRGITNRDLFSNNFIGGTKKTIVKFENSTPIIGFCFILFSSQNNLDVKIKTQIELRLKLINPNYFIEFDYINNGVLVDAINGIENEDHLKSQKIIEEYDEIVKYIGEQNTRDLIKMVNKKPIKIGLIE
jgi:hypothetical protein